MKSMIEISHVTKKFNDFVAIEDLTYTIKDSCIYGLMGYNGAGKTTLLKTIAGIYQADQGRVTINEVPVFENEPLKRTIFLVQDDPYFLTQSSLKTMAKFYKGYYPSWSHKTFHNLTQFFGLDPQARISSFSKGMQRQAALLLGLSTMPQCLLLDEAFDGLDLSKRNMLNHILRQYMAEKKVTVIISSHNLRELEGICDHVGIIKDRKLVFSSAVAEIKHTQHKYRAAFAQTVKSDELLSLGFKMPSQDGRLFTFFWGGNSDEVGVKLSSFQPILIESLPLSLEEIFLEYLEEKDYDVKTIF